MEANGENQRNIVMVTTKSSSYHRLKRVFESVLTSKGCKRALFISYFLYEINKNKIEFFYDFISQENDFGESELIIVFNVSKQCEIGTILEEDFGALSLFVGSTSEELKLAEMEMVSDIYILDGDNLENELLQFLDIIRRYENDK